MKMRHINSDDSTIEIEVTSSATSVREGLKFLFRFPLTQKSMKRAILLMLLLCTNSFLFPQDNEAIKERTLIILSSADNAIPPSLKSEIDSMDSIYKDLGKQSYTAEESIVKDPIFKKMNGSRQTMILEGNRFIKNINFFNSVGFNIARYLQSIYSDYDYKNFNVFALSESSQQGRVEDMQKIALKFNVKYILNVHKIKVFVSPVRKVVIEAELYNARTKKLVFQKKFDGESVNPGGYFMCEEGSTNCCLSNATQKLFYEILKTVD